jgi:DNA-binding transcriptional regulator YhcF (GntR family)
MADEEVFSFDSVQQIPEPNFDPVLQDPPAKGTRQKFSVELAWTPTLAKRYVPVSRAFLENYFELGITVEEAIFIIHLFQYKWNERAPIPGYKRLSSAMGVSVKTARRYAQNLERKGYINRVRRDWDTNRFDLRPLFRALEHVIEEKKKAKKSREPKLRDFARLRLEAHRTLARTGRMGGRAA